jgi:putative DNA primase/helicase
MAGDDKKMEALLQLIDSGMRVIPLHHPTNNGCSCRKPDCKSIGKHPRLKIWAGNASANPEQIRAWWTKWPQGNVGVVTGSISAAFVVDVDGFKGEESVRKLETKYGPLPATLTAITGRGRHLYFQHPGIPVKNSAGRLGMGLDVRADGGFVVAPPSVHVSGKQYVWTDADAEISKAPNWLLDLITVEDVPTSSGELIPEGKRTDTLYNESCSLFRAGVPKSTVMATILALNAQRCSPPLPKSEVTAIVSRVAKTNKPAKSRSSATNPLRWYPHDTTNFLTNQNILTLTPCQLGWRTRLLNYAWPERGRLINDPAKLAILANEQSKKKFVADIGKTLFDFEPVASVNLIWPLLIFSFGPTLW